MIAAAKRHISRGKPVWSENSEELYQSFLETDDHEIADELLDSLNTASRYKWPETVGSV